MLCLIIAYVYSSTKLEKRAERFYLEARGMEEEREGAESKGKIGPNNVCTYE
jgi:hypothetical protein